VPDPAKDFTISCSSVGYNDADMVTATLWRGRCRSAAVHSRCLGRPGTAYSRRRTGGGPSGDDVPVSIVVSEAESVAVLVSVPVSVPLARAPAAAAPGKPTGGVRASAWVSVVVCRGGGRAVPKSKLCCREGG
jgi:hypothetical protein